MIKKLIAMAVIAAFAGSAYAEKTFKADPTHAHIGFSVSHMVISKVKGSFGDFDATLVFDESDTLVSAEAEIKVDSIDTDNEKRDTHLKSEDFFNVDKHPLITFKSTDITKDGSEVQIKGNLTIAGVTKEIVMNGETRGPVKDPWGNTKLGLGAALIIDRTAFGITWSKALETGHLVVGNEVEIEIDVEFAQQ